MVKQRYGRIVNVTSTSGIYGSFGQSNYVAAVSPAGLRGVGKSANYLLRNHLQKCGIIGLSHLQASEGAKHNIIVNVVAPTASTPNLLTVLRDFPRDWYPVYCAPMVALLSSNVVPYPSSGGLYEIGCGWQGRTRLQMTGGVEILSKDEQPTVKSLDPVADFARHGADYPETSPSDLPLIAEQLLTARVLEKIDTSKGARTKSSVFEYSHRDVILYSE
jgi:multifunctional beta-oxidation protein